MERLWGGIIFAVGKPSPEWNGLVVQHIFAELGGIIPSGVNNLFKTNSKYVVYGMDDDTKQVHAVQITETLYTSWVPSGQNTCTGVYPYWKNWEEGPIISPIINGLNTWVLYDHPFLQPTLDKALIGDKTDYCMSPTSYMVFCDHASKYRWLLFRAIRFGLEKYAEWCKTMDIPFAYEYTPGVFDPVCNGSPRVTYFDVKTYQNSASNHHLLTLREMDHKVNFVSNPSRVDAGKSVYSADLKMPRYAMGERYLKTPVYLLSMAWGVSECNGFELENCLAAHKFAMYIWKRLTKNQEDKLKSDKESIYDNEETITNKKQKIMATAKKNSFMERLMNIYKGQFIPEKCDEFALTFDGQVVAKCPAGVDTVYNAIVDGQVVSYPSEMVMDISLYTIVRPVSSIAVGDIVVLSGVSTGNRYGKVTKITKAKDKITGFEVIRFNGTTDGAATVKDAITKQTFVEVVINPFDTKNNLIGSNNGQINPMMFMLMGDDKMDMDKILMMSMMSGNNPLGSNNGQFNPMMFLFMGDGKMDMDKILMMSMMSGKNPFEGFQLPVVNASEMIQEDKDATDKTSKK